MCGIYLAISKAGDVQPSAELLTLLQHRGPDSTTVISRQTADSYYHLTFASTVLSLRGASVVKQPYFVSEDDEVLCWNGEAWSIAGQPVEGNDTTAVFELLALHISTDVDQHLKTLATRLSTVAGPYAFVFYDKHASRVYFGRDLLGRRSLLWHVNEHGDLLISSISAGGTWAEVDADGLYCIDLEAREQPADVQWGNFNVSRHEYHYINDHEDTIQQSVLPRLILNKALPTTPVTTLNEHSSSVTALQTHLYDACNTRILDIPEPPSILDSNESSSVSKLAILFSGGLDCTVLARIAHDLLPVSEPIDLLNVAFENPRIHKKNNQENYSPYELCPDRITGRASFTELLEVCPGRLWRFVSINIPYTETLQHREKIMLLMYPHNTEMDLSISCALYFAARGIGLLSTRDGQDTGLYTTHARVLLSGLGADELFAGYNRHAVAFRMHGFDGLFNELDLDVGRLGKRNLGRDDRVISHWSKEVRFPYLDEALVHWALQALISDKVGCGGPSNNVGECLEDGKKVLRCLAWKLGMCTVAKEKKRAIQFGARTAKMETGKTKGTTILA